jgi:hypothetical protein
MHLSGSELSAGFGDLAQLSHSGVHTKKSNVMVVAGRLCLLVVGFDGQQSIIVQGMPDMKFGQNEAVWPSVVIEVSYSQKRVALPNLANDYILTTDNS